MFSRAKESGPRLPKSVPGFPQIKVEHVHFGAAEYPILEAENGIEMVQVLSFSINAAGYVLSRKRESEAAPLEDVTRAIEDNMVACAKATKDDRYSFMYLVTNDRSPRSIGIIHCLQPMRKYGGWL